MNEHDRKVYVVIINWNGWKYTIECLESLKKQSYKNFQVVISDNASSDESLKLIMEYLSGKNLISPANSEIFKKYVEPVTHDKVMFFEYTSEQIESKEFKDTPTKASENNALSNPVIIIRNSKNYGTSKGNNVGFRYALSQADASYIWVLNNDVALDPNALANLVKDCDSDPQIGATASVLRFYDNPDTVQTIGGGKFYPILGIAKLCGKNSLVSDCSKKQKSEILSKMNYLMSCSMLVKAETFRQCGIYDEDFFVYTEETEWSFRIQKLGWKISVALDSFVFHKESVSTKGVRHMYFYLLYKHNQIFVRKHFGRAIAAFALIPMVLNAARTAGCIQNFKGAIKGISEGFFRKIGPALTLSYIKRIS